MNLLLDVFAAVIFPSANHIGLRAATTRQEYV